MISNREIIRLFNLYAELLLLHQKDEDLSALLSGAVYATRTYSGVRGAPHRLQAVRPCTRLCDHPTTLIEIIFILV